MRPGRHALTVLVLLVTVLLPAPAQAATVVTVSDDAFTPATVTVPLGGTVSWSFAGFHTHTVTSDIGIWDSGDRQHGESYDLVFTSSGAFAYHCEHHSSMHGKVVVRLQASGGPAVGWRLRWSTTTAPAGRAFDAQYRREGTATWRNFRVDTKAATGLFNPTRAGRYFLRARTTNTATGQESGWSHQLLKRIT